MKIIQNIFIKNISTLICGCLISLLGNSYTNAQQNLLNPLQVSMLLPVPAPKVRVTKIQDLSFGAFCIGPMGGGTVVIPSVGSRSATGDVILFPTDNGGPAIIRLTNGRQRLVTITVNNVVNLTDGAGHSLTLQINDIYPTSPYIPPDGDSYSYIGGTITVGSQSTNPAGNYVGSFTVTYNQQ